MKLLAPSFERLKAALSYDPETGFFTWKNVTKHHRRLNGTVAGSQRPSGYIWIKLDCCAYPAHRLAWMFAHGEVALLDHINGVRNDNRIDNLRPATIALNALNHGKRRRKNGRLVGSKEWKGRFYARITYRKKQYYIGVYDTEAQAHCAYLRKRAELFQEWDRNHGG